MTDYFAVLDQPRAPWLDPAELKDVFHRKTLQAHPDVADAGATQDFAELNEAYQVLHDPKRRLEHLLSLENAAPQTENPNVPEDLQELFMKIGELNQRMTALLAKTRGASSPLSRSLLKPELITAEKEVAELRHKTGELIAAADLRLRQTDARQIDELSALHQRFAYLGRWSEQLDDLAFQLSL